MRLKLEITDGETIQVMEGLIEDMNLIDSETISIRLGIDK